MVVASVAISEVVVSRLLVGAFDLSVNSKIFDISKSPKSVSHFK